MKYPRRSIKPSSRPYTGLPTHPTIRCTIRPSSSTRCGRICLGKEKNQLQHSLPGQAVGIKKVHDDIWLVSFMD